MKSQRVEGDEDGVDFPEWLLLETLTRLPIKTIFISRCVSKQWNSLTSDPSFAQFYVSRRKINSASSSSSSSSSLAWKTFSGFADSFCRKNNPHYAPSVYVVMMILNLPICLRQQQQQQQRYPELPDWCVVRATSSGLFLCSANDSTVLYVCNPLTRQWVLLPEHTNYFKTSVSEGFVTQFEGAVVTSYKVVRLQRIFRYESTDNILKMEIFDSQTGVWKRQDVNCLKSIRVIWHKNPVLLNGILHWFTKRPFQILAYHPYKNIDQCRLIELPPVGNYLPSCALCGVSQGHLQYIETVRGGFRVWVLKDYDSGKWYFQYSIVTRLETFIRDEFPKKSLALHPLNSDIVYFRARKGILSYNNRSQHWELIYHLCFNELVLVLPFVLPLWPPSVPQPLIGSQLTYN